MMAGEHMRAPADQRRAIVGTTPNGVNCLNQKRMPVAVRRTGTSYTARVWGRQFVRTAHAPPQPTANPAPLSLLGRGTRLVGHGLLALGHAAANIHEATARAGVHPLPATRMVEGPRTRRDEPTDDHVFLQAAQIVLQATDRCFGEHAGRLLERCRRDERFGRQRRLRDAEQHRLDTSRNLALLRHALVDIGDSRLVELLAAQQRGITGVCDLDLAEHLANDHLDVLVVDLHALQSIDVLNLAHEVVRKRLDALQPQNVVRVRLAVRDDFAALHLLAFEHVEMTPFRNQLFVLLALLIRDDQTTLALGLLTEAHGARVLGEDRGVLRFARFEQVGNARQTTRDIASLRRLLRDTCDDVAHRDLHAVFQAHDRTRRQRVHGWNVGVRERDFLTLCIDEAHDRTQVLAAGAALLRIHHDRARQTRYFIDLTLNRQTIDEVLELDEARHFRDDRVRMRIPRREDLPRLDAIAILDVDDRAIRDLVTLSLATELVDDAELARARHRHPVTFLVVHRLQVMQTRRTATLRFDRVRGRRSRCRATDVERTHRELRAGLADRLCRDDANGFAQVDAMTAREVTSVALCAHAVARLTRDRRANLDLIDAFLLELLHQLLVDQDARFDYDRIAARTHHILCHDAPENALAETLNDIAAFDDRAHRETVRRAAILFCDDEVLRDVDETTGEITRVRGLQRGVGETFTGAVRRDEVLHRVQAFTEVRRDRRLDDRAVRLRHETAHTRELTNLGRATASTGIRHHVDRVERFLRRGFALRVHHVFDTELVHHGLRHLIVRTRPNVDDLVVTLAVRDETRSVLL